MSESPSDIKKFVIIFALKLLSPKNERKLQSEVLTKYANEMPQKINNEKAFEIMGKYFQNFRFSKMSVNDK